MFVLHQQLGYRTFRDTNDWANHEVHESFYSLSTLADKKLRQCRLRREMSKFLVVNNLIDGWDCIPDGSRLKSQ